MEKQYKEIDLKTAKFSSLDKGAIGIFARVAANRGGVISNYTLGIKNLDVSQIALVNGEQEKAVVVPAEQILEPYRWAKMAGEDKRVKSNENPAFASQLGIEYAQNAIPGDDALTHFVQTTDIDTTLERIINNSSFQMDYMRRTSLRRELLGQTAFRTKQIVKTAKLLEEYNRHCVKEFYKPQMDQLHTFANAENVTNLFEQAR